MRPLGETEMSWNILRTLALYSKFIHRMVHITVSGTAALLRTMLTKQSRGPLKEALVVLMSSFELKWPNNRLPDCHHIHIVVHHTLSGTAAVLRSMLTKQQSQGPLPEFMRMQHAVPKTVTLFMCRRTTQSLGLLPFFEPYSTKQYRGPLPGFTRMLHAVPKTVTLFICEYGDSPGACCLVTLIQKTTAVPWTVLCTTVWIWLQSWGLLFCHYDSNYDSNPTDWVVHHHMNRVTVLGTVCCILVNPGNCHWDCCLLNTLQRTAAVPETVLCTTTWIWL